MADFLEGTGSAEDEVVLDGVGVVQAKFDGSVGGDLKGGLAEAELVWLSNSQKLVDVVERLSF